MLSLGVEGKLALWQALRRALAGDPRLDGIDLPTLVERARAQRRTLERQRRRAADEVLGLPVGSRPTRHEDRETRSAFGSPT